MYEIASKAGILDVDSECQTTPDVDHDSLGMIVKCDASTLVPKSLPYSLGTLMPEKCAYICGCGRVLWLDETCEDCSTS